MNGYSEGCGIGCVIGYSDAHQFGQQRQCAIAKVVQVTGPNQRSQHGLNHLHLAPQRRASAFRAVTRGGDASQGGAAAFSGRVQVGDVVVTIDGQPTGMIHPDTIRQWFVGEPGTALVLVLADPHSGQVGLPS